MPIPPSTHTLMHMRMRELTCYGRDVGKDSLLRLEPAVCDTHRPLNHGRDVSALLAARTEHGAFQNKTKAANGLGRCRIHVV